MKEKKVELTPIACKHSSNRITLQLVVSGLVSGISSPVTAISMMPIDSYNLGHLVAIGRVVYCLIVYSENPLKPETLMTRQNV